jgi:ABC-type transport system substrate-binding protein
MQRVRLLLFSAALLVSLFCMTAFTSVSIASAHTNAQASHAHATVPHHPLVTCSANGCNGLNPATTGCSADAYTVQTATFSNSFVQLRYSPTCGTNWGRVISRVGATSLVITIQRNDNLTYTFSGGNFTFAWVAMVYAPNVPARACGGVSSTSGCTAFV